ncbi:DUF4282 domain-containing protein [Pseudonocardia sp. Cha107L01]|uniref:DUF4282 domain-containing protein n=1 Tax=Pseudonocardia sp. Cha107L01 TaxID=3457576 RepID=UPI00403E5AF1
MKDEPPSTGLPDPADTLRVLPDPAGTLRALLRARFDLPLTPRLVPPLFLGFTVLAGVGGVTAIVAAFSTAFWLGLLALVTVPFPVLGAIALVRIFGELALAMIQVTEDVAGIAVRFPRLESTIDDVASVVPRLNFIRLLSGTRER